MKKINHVAALELLKELQVKLDYVSGTNPIYVGYAHPEAATSESVWHIIKITYDSNNNVTAIQHSGGTPNPDDIWDDRTALSYS